MARALTVLATLALALPTAACNCGAAKRAEVARAVNARVAAVAAQRLRGGTAAGINPVSNFNMSAYTGLWYQVYDDAVVQSTFEGSKVCVTAQCTWPPRPWRRTDPSVAARFVLHRTCIVCGRAGGAGGAGVRRRCVLRPRPDYPPPTTTPPTHTRNHAHTPVQMPTTPTAASPSLTRATMAARRAPL